MTSKTRISSPCEKQNSDKRDSSTSFTDETLSKVTLRTHKSKKKSKRSRLAIEGEEDNSQADSGLFPIEANVLNQESNSNSGFVEKNKNSIKANEKVVKRNNIENVETESLVESDLVNVVEELHMCDFTKINLYEKLKKYKKNIKHKQSESDIEPKNKIVEPSNNSKEKREKTKLLQIKNRNGSEDELQNKSFVKKVVLCQTDSPVMKPRDNRKLPKRIFSLSQSSLDHILSDDNDTTLCSTKSLDESKQKKCKRKYKSNSKELKDSYCSMFDENEEQLTNVQNQESAAFSEHSSYPEPSYKNHVSAELSSSLTTSKKKKRNISVCSQPSSPDINQHTSTKYQQNEMHNSEDVMSNTSYIYNTKSKKKSSSFLYNQTLPTTLNENNYCDVKEPNKSKETSVKSKKHKLSVTSGGEFDESKYELPQNPPKTKTKQNYFEISNKFSSKEITTNKKKAKENSGQKSKGILSNNEKLDIEQIQKDLLAQALNKVNLHSDKNSLLNKLLQAESSRINIKPNEIPSVVEVKTTNKTKPIKTKVNAVLSNKSSFDNFTDNSVYKSPNKKIESKQRTAYLSTDKPLDIDKIQQDLLAVALKNIHKSPKSKKIKRLVKTVEGRNYQVPDKETVKKEMPKIIHKNKSAMLSKMTVSMPTQALPQPSTSQDVGSIGQFQSDKYPKTTNLHKTNKKASILKTVKHKPKLNQDAEFDISTFQQELLSAALKKVKSIPTKSKNSKLHQGTNTETSKKKPVKYEDNIESTKVKQAESNNTTKCIGEVKEKSKIMSKKKLKAKSIIDPLEDFTAKLLSAELKKRNI